MKVNKIIAAAVAITIVGGTTTGYLPVRPAPSCAACSAEAVSAASEAQHLPYINLTEEPSSESFMEDALGAIRLTAVRIKVVAALIHLEYQWERALSLLPPFAKSSVVAGRDAVAE